MPLTLCRHEKRPTLRRGRSRSRERPAANVAEFKRKESRFRDRDSRIAN